VPEAAVRFITTDNLPDLHDRVYKGEVRLLLPIARYLLPELACENDGGTFSDGKEVTADESRAIRKGINQGQAERDLSIPDQITQLREYCRKHNHEVLEAILVLTTSRFFRDALGARKYKHELKKKGVQVISITQEVKDDMETKPWLSSGCWISTSTVWTANPSGSSGSRKS